MNSRFFFAAFSLFMRGSRIFNQRMCRSAA